MTGMDDDLIAKIADAEERLLHCRRIAEWKIRAPDGAREQQIPSEEQPATAEYDAPRRVSRRVEPLEAERPEPELVAVRERLIRRTGLLERDAVDGRLNRTPLVQRQVRRMEIDRHVPHAFHAGDAADVIDVRVRQPDGLERGARGAH